MVLGELETVEELEEMESKGTDWGQVCLGSFYIKPNYPGRSSHVCNGGFLVTDAARNRGVGRLMGEGYLEWAPKLVSRIVPTVALLEMSDVLILLHLDFALLQ